MDSAPQEPPSSRLHPKRSPTKGNHLGVSKNGGTPKWFIYNGKPYQNG